MSSLPVRIDPLNALVQAASQGPPIPDGALVVVSAPLSPILVNAPPFGILGTSDAVPGAGVLRYMGVNLAIEDYMPFRGSSAPEEERQSVIERLLEHYDRTTFLHVAAELAASIGKPDLVSQLQDTFQDFLGEYFPQSLGRFNIAMSDRKRSFLGRHVLLRAMREILSQPEPQSPRRILPPAMTLVMLAHALAGQITTDKKASGSSTIGGIPEDLAMSMVCNFSFHTVDDIYASLDRQLRLWNDYGPKVKHLLRGREPRELLSAATGTDLEDFLAIGLGLFAHFLGWKPGAPVGLDNDLGSDMPASIRNKVFDHICEGLDELSARIDNRSKSHWDLLALQERPVLRVDGTLLVLDGVFLADRFTSGLFWIVHDHIKNMGGEIAANDWRIAWGNMVEKMAMDDFRLHAPPLVNGDQTFFDLTTTDPKIKKKGQQPKAADCAIDFGEAIGVFEVVSGRLKNPTRIDGDRCSFDDDMEKILLKKIRQLDATVRNLIDHPEDLFGAGVPARPIQPVIVAGEEFPLSPVITRYVEEYLDNNGYLRNQLVRPLAIIDLSELEVLEGLRERGYFILNILSEWRESDIGEMPLRNYLLKMYPWDPELYRPASMRPRVDSTFKILVERLRIRRRS